MENLAKVSGRGWRGLAVCFSLAALCGCMSEGDNANGVKRTIGRYNELLTAGYLTYDMNPLQEVTTREVATKAYHHMAALGEGKLRMEPAVKKIDFTSIRFPGNDRATAETSETWDFTHIDTTSGRKFAEEKDFMYEMTYTLKRSGGRWIIDRVETIKGTSTNTVIPWPDIDRSGARRLSPGAGKQ
jgi:hypothetical protein